MFARKNVSVLWGRRAFCSTSKKCEKFQPSTTLSEPFVRRQTAIATKARVRYWHLMPMKEGNGTNFATVN